MRAFRAYGVTCAIRADRADLAPVIETALPPVFEEADASAAAVTFEVQDRDSSLAVLQDGALVGAATDPDVAAGILDMAVRARISVAAPDRIFVHAGAVAHGGRAIVIPGRSFSGKTTLVAALLARGATYLSDEYAVLDDAGLVHPYPRALGMRSNGARGGERVQPAALGVAVAGKPLPVGTIAITSYRPGARWEPQPRTSGEGALALLANTVPARTRPAEAMRAVRAAASDAAVVESERGEADDAARGLLP